MTRPGPPDEPRVRRMFDSLVPRYDLVNDILSMGLDRVWRRAVVRTLAVGPADQVLDLGCGTGMLVRRLNRDARAVGIDVSLPMLRRARGVDPTVRWVQGSAFHLPFRDASFTAVASAFVLRNLDDLPGAFAEIVRVTSPGGRIAMVDITAPEHPVFRRAFDAYVGVAAPALGSLVGRRDEYEYLVRSLAHLPGPDEMAGILWTAGLEHPRSRPLMGGIATLYTARRPEG